METKTPPASAPTAKPEPKQKRRSLRWLAGPAIGASATIVAALIALIATPNSGVSIANISIGQQPTRTVMATTTVTPPAATVTVAAPVPVEPTGTVTPSVVAPDGTTMLVKREAVESETGSGYDVGAYKVNGTLYSDSLSYTMGPCDQSGAQGFTGWDLGGEFQTLHTVIGLRGDSNPETQAKYTFIGDGRELKAVTVKWRQHENLEIDVSGILRLQLKAAVVAESAGECRGHAYPTWGQPYLTLPAG